MGLTIYEDDDYVIGIAENGSFDLEVQIARLDRETGQVLDVRRVPLWGFTNRPTLEEFFDNVEDSQPMGLFEH